MLENEEKTEQDLKIKFRPDSSLKSSPNTFLYRFKGSDFFYWILLLFFAEGFGIVALMLVYATPSYYCGPLALHWDLLDPEERTMMDVLGKYLNHSEAGDGTVWSFHNVVTIIYSAFKSFGLAPKFGHF